ncbi:MAG TPA: hypothetical protein P5256_18160 [Beijerinckiaceae bacterium]|nr:hypothetical protein [Methylobacteriaceae bacterium]MCC0002400.1 hypothetical protein [Methylobacteriaceae bacterium]HRY05061.1 hypothetical protein [Beijerinckiaceae bacterium]
MLRHLHICLVATFFFSTPAFADGIGACMPTGSTPLCSPAKPWSRYVIDLGSYRGIFAINPQSPQTGAVAQRFACPSTGRCVCELTTNADPVGDWNVVFSGRPPSDGKPREIPIKFTGGHMTMGPSFLGGNVTLKGNRLAISNHAFRTAIFERDGKPATWVIEYWDCVKMAFQNLPPSGQLRVNLIAGVENNALGPAAEALTASDDATGFSAIPSFLESDPHKKRAVRPKR